MNALVFPGTSLQELRANLLDAVPSEAASILIAGIHRTNSGDRLLVRQALSVPESGYRIQGDAAVSIEPTFLNRALKSARTDGTTLAIVHTHPLWRFLACPISDVS